VRLARCSRGTILVADVVVDDDDDDDPDPDSDLLPNNDDITQVATAC